MMYLLSGVRRKHANREVCPRTKVPFEVDTWEAREFRGAGGFSCILGFFDLRFFEDVSATGVAPFPVSPSPDGVPSFWSEDPDAEPCGSVPGVGCNE